jgi:hypothetical protein
MANYPLNFRGIVDALADAVVQAGGTLANYPANFEGVIEALEDLKTAIASGGGGGGTTNHALLSNLSYATSGHTGFASSADLTSHTGNTSNPHSTTRAQLGAAGSGANSDITSLEGVTGIITVGGKKHTRSSTTPTTPTIGDTWEELNGSGNIIGRWFWNGTYWLSEQLFTSGSFVTAAASANGINWANGMPKNGSNIWVEAFQATAHSSSAHNGTDFWTFQLLRHTGANAFDVTGATITTQTLLANTVTTYRADVNQVLANSDINFWRATYTPSGTTITVRLDFEVMTRVIR